MPLLNLRVSDDEKATWQKVAEHLSLSEWIRQTLNAACQPKAPPATSPSAERKTRSQGEPCDTCKRKGPPARPCEVCGCSKHNPF